ncbi:MAG: sensor histidine kinase [Desulfobacterales bacterium]
MKKEFEQKQLLWSALINILENALDACLEDHAHKLHKIIFRVSRNEDQILFEVRDNGIGMDQETKESLFTLFFSSKGNRGTGLGLFITYKIIEQHGGKIIVDATLGEGSRFLIQMPRVISESKKKGFNDV